MPAHLVLSVQGGRGRRRLGEKVGFDEGITVIDSEVENGDRRFSFYADLWTQSVFGIYFISILFIIYGRLLIAFHDLISVNLAVENYRCINNEV